MNVDFDRRFWGRITFQAVVVNIPLAWAAITAGLSLGVALGLSAAMGAITLVIWDGIRTPPITESKPDMQIRVLPTPSEEHSARGTVQQVAERG